MAGTGGVSRESGAGGARGLGARGRVPAEQGLSRAHRGVVQSAVPRSWRGAALVAVSLALFIALATLNAGGYRYGASDQAFYVPAVQHHLDPSLFPRDWPMLAAQDQLNAFTPLVASIARLTGTSVPALFFSLYLAGLAALGAAALLIARTLFRSHWTAAALLAALTLRHAVALGAVNTLEGYMHPRMIAFAAGSLAIGTFLRGRYTGTALLVVVAGVVHPTTAIWFALWLAVAVMVAEPRSRLPLAGAAGVGVLAAAWALAAGPLAGRLVRMDEAWVAALDAKTYLFPDRWPVWGWASAAIPVLAVTAIHVLRRRARTSQSSGAATREAGLVAGALTLAGVFLASVPFTAARVAFAVQLQVPRVLWMLDLLAVTYLVWLLAEAGGAVRRTLPSRRPALVAVLLVAAAAGRGAWVMLAEHPERRAVQVGLAATDWNHAMEWVRTQTPPPTHVLAHPGHAWQHGTSVRVAASRDVFLEEAKDAAFALYSREAAVRFVERVGASQGFANFGAGELGRLAARYGLDVLVTDRILNLPLLYRTEASRCILEAAVVGGRRRAEGGTNGSGVCRRTACRLPPAACRLPPTAYRLPPTAYRLWPTAYRPPTAASFGGYEIPNCSRYVLYFDGS